jgi:hypothetical protein
MGVSCDQNAGQNLISHKYFEKVAYVVSFGNIKLIKN